MSFVFKGKNRYKMINCGGFTKDSVEEPSIANQQKRLQNLDDFERLLRFGTLLTNPTNLISSKILVTK